MPMPVEDGEETPVWKQVPVPDDHEEWTHVLKQEAVPLPVLLSQGQADVGLQPIHGGLGKPYRSPSELPLAWSKSLFRPSYRFES